MKLIKSCEQSSGAVACKKKPKPNNCIFAVVSNILSRVFNTSP